MARVLVLGNLAESLVNFRGELMKAMVASGHSVVACAPDAPPSVIDALAALGVEYRHVSLTRAGMNVFQDLHTLLFLGRLLRRENPDILFSYTAKPVLYGSLAARAAGIPSVFSMITGLGYLFSGEEFRSHLLAIVAKPLYRCALKNNRKVFFQNPDDRRLFEEKRLVDGEQAVLVNGSGVDLGRFRPAAYPDDMSFLMIARLIRGKGVREYAQAAQQVRARHPGVRFVLVGGIDGNPTAISRQELTSWTDRGILEYRGALADVRPALAASSVYVLPSSSYREGLPRTVLEAMAMARPIITTDVPGCRETVVEGGNGYLIPSGNADALANAMERFIKDPGLVATLGRRSREFAEQKYDVRDVNEVILKTMGLVP